MDLNLSPLIKINDVIAEFNLTQQQANAILESCVQTVTTEIYRNWTEAAKRTLHSTRNGYINGLIIVDKGRLSKQIVLTGALNNNMENGISAFDLKEIFRKSAKVKYTAKGGWYLTIPFRFATPGSVGENSAFSNVMPQEVYDVVSKLKAASSTKAPVERYKGAGEPASREAFSDIFSKKSFEAYVHKSSIYEGLQKNSAAYANTTQNKYNTFRRVSANSDSNSWIHRGFAALNLANQAVTAISLEQIVDNTIDTELTNLGH